jgi:hypothetical protein
MQEDKRTNCLVKLIADELDVFGLSALIVLGDDLPWLGTFLSQVSWWGFCQWGLGWWGLFSSDCFDDIVTLDEFRKELTWIGFGC